MSTMNWKIRLTLAYLQSISIGLAAADGKQSDDCVNSSIGHCSGENQDSNLVYSPPNNPDDSDLNLAYGEFAFDRLSARDQTIFRSKKPDYWKADGQDTTLRQVLLIHRHGDRTPIQFSEGDKIGKHLFWQLHGLGQLTNRGKARLSMLGQIVRMRYNIFLDGSVNKNMRKSRSSGALRCIESAQVFLSSFLSLNKSNSPDASELNWDDQNNSLSHLWQPASVNTVAAKVDGMLNEGAACKNLDREYDLLDGSAENKQISLDFKYESKVMKEVWNFDTDHFYKWFWGSSMLEVERSYLENMIDERLLQAYDRIDKAGNRAIVLYQSTLPAKRLRAGLLINDMIQNMKTHQQIAQGNLPDNMFNKKFVHYSAHDLNLVVLLGMFDNIDKYPFRPDYAANIIIELHQDQDEWFIRLFYMHHVPSQYIELHIARCEEGNPKRRCTLDRFDAIMQEYKIASWQNWMKECDNDMSLVDPYSQNS